ncbi:MAG: beta-Ala-His dipeptidase [Spirochaetales bacterium]|jgi:dipeptidase D|nr:beta-Ala-His dipeptidase [Spirochaetales bacterium]
MSAAIEGLEPRGVWRWFEKISEVPRGSGKEEKIRDFLLGFARERGLEAQTDPAGNLVIRVPASPGREGEPPLILQGHMDMVWEKNKTGPGAAFNFETDPISLVRRDGWITAGGTTLGADNGIALAIALAAAEDPSLSHSPLELFFTVDEETGLVGAVNMDPRLLTGKRLLNLDSEDENTLYIGCAGGVNTEGFLDLSLEPLPPGEWRRGILSVTGCRGGHSGAEIHRGLANALLIGMRILLMLEQKTGTRLKALTGGGLHNVIPRECFAALCFPAGEEEKVRSLIQGEGESFCRAFGDIEPDMAVSLEVLKEPGWTAVFEEPGGDKSAGESGEIVLTPESFKRAVSLVYALPHGVIRMSRKMPDLVETSTNLAAVKIAGGALHVLTSQRSSGNFLRDDAADRITAAFYAAGGSARQDNRYPGWDPNPDSPLLKTCAAAFRRINAREPEIKAIHAGLECGVIGDKIPGIDMVSLGPDIEDVHSPQERVSIPSVGRVWELLKIIMETPAL